MKIQIKDIDKNYTIPCTHRLIYFKNSNSANKFARELVKYISCVNNVNSGAEVFQGEGEFPNHKVGIDYYVAFDLIINKRYDSEEEKERELLLKIISKYSKHILSVWVTGYE